MVQDVDNLEDQEGVEALPENWSPEVRKPGIDALHPYELTQRW
jgi:hypothetical protein